MCRKILYSGLLVLFLISLPTNVIPGEKAVHSLLGKPVTALTGSLLRYDIEMIDPKNRGISPDDARHALKNSQLLDPTLPEVRFHEFPHVATIKLISKMNPERSFTVDFSGLGILHRGKITYVFRYSLPETKKSKITDRKM